MYSNKKLNTDPPVWLLDIYGDGGLELTVRLVNNEKKKTSQVKKTGELLLLQQKVKWLKQDFGSHISKSPGRFY
jgi:hypothetical protein